MSNPSKAFTNVYEQIYSMLSYDPNKIKDPNVVITLNQNKSIDPADYDNMYAPYNIDGDVQKTFNFVTLADTLPNSTGTLLPREYSAIVKDANVNVQNTEAQKKKYEDIWKQLYNGYATIQDKKGNNIKVLQPTDGYAAYQRAENSYSSAVSDYFSDFAKIDTKSIAAQAKLKEINANLKIAYDDFVANGADKYRRLLSELTTASNNAVAGIIADAKSMVANNFLSLPNVGSFGLTYPLLSKWLPSSTVYTKDKLAALDLEYETQISNLEDRIDKTQRAIDSTTDKEEKANLKDELADLKEQLKDVKADYKSNRADIIAEGKSIAIDTNEVLYSTFEFISSKYSEHKHSSENSYKAGVAFSWGLFSIGGTGGYSDKHTSADTETDDIKITGKICQVPIVRPWFDPFIFGLDGWTNMAYKKGQISDGKGQNGKLPMYTTSLIIVKDLSIESKFSHTKIETSEKSWSVDASIGFGPFRFGPKYSHSESDFKLDKTNDGYRITNKGFQIIGTVNSIVPFSPTGNDPSTP